jgi:hypothetical protein
LAENAQEGWRRINFYAFGINVDELQKAIADQYGESSQIREALSSIPALSRAVLAGGLVFKGISCLLKEGNVLEETLSLLERSVPSLRILEPQDLREIEILKPVESYWLMYKGILPGLTRVIFFEYATQIAFMGLAREKDLPVVEEFYLDLERLHDYTTIPKPLRTDEYDARSDIYLFLIRNPLKEELQGDYVKKLIQMEGLKLYTVAG